MRAEPGKVCLVPEIPPCDFCTEAALGPWQPPVPGPYDFATRYGPWAHGCASCWVEHRAFPDLGVGRGQLWITEETTAKPTGKAADS